MAQTRPHQATAEARPGRTTEVGNLGFGCSDDARGPADGPRKDQEVIVMSQSRHRRRSKILACAVTAALAATACSGAGGGAGSGGGKSINVLMVDNPQMEDIQRLTADNFTKQTGIKVNYTILPEN